MLGSRGAYRDEQYKIVVGRCCPEVRGPTKWTITRYDGPNHLGLWYNALPEHQMALITSDCAPSRAARRMSVAVALEKICEAPDTCESLRRLVALRP